jgi:hypothetical protein
MLLSTPVTYRKSNTLKDDGESASARARRGVLYLFFGSICCSRGKYKEQLGISHAVVFLDSFGDKSHHRTDGG